MIAKGPLVLSKEQKLSKEVIEASFGARLRSLGFVSRKNGTEWYAILKEKLKKNCFVLYIWMKSFFITFYIAFNRFAAELLIR